MSVGLPGFLTVTEDAMYVFFLCKLNVSYKKKKTYPRKIDDKLQKDDAYKLTEKEGSTWFFSS